MPKSMIVRPFLWSMMWAGRRAMGSPHVRARAPALHKSQWRISQKPTPAKGADHAPPLAPAFLPPAPITREFETHSFSSDVIKSQFGVLGNAIFGAFSFESAA